MTVRAVPCPKCRRVPETVPIEQGGFRTHCATAKCRMALDCLGATEDASRTCWNGCIDRRDYR